jgi:dephospho-CoA kinase
MLRVGLTGGIACGKSRALERFARHGFATLDLDGVAHEVMCPGRPAYVEVVDAFGRGVVAPDGSIDRRALGAIVFGDPEARLRLNAILHPRVRHEEGRLAAVEERGGATVLVTAAALLIESGAHLRFDRLLVVDCSPEAQVRRLKERDGMNEAAARSRVDAQMPGSAKRRFAHELIDSSGAPEDTDADVDRVASALDALAEAPPPSAHIDLENALGLMVRGPSEGPRGLAPITFLREIVETGSSLEMDRLARLLKPAPEGPWYEAARAVPGEPGPEALAVPLALWAVSRRGADVDFLAAAAYSVAVLTAVDASRQARGCLSAFAVQDLVLNGRVPGDLSRLEGLAERWCRALPGEAWRDALPGHLESMARRTHAERKDASLVHLLERLVSRRQGA